MSGSLDILGMLNPGMAGFAAAPAFDYGSALGAMNPGMTGFGGGATNVGGFDAASPLTDNSTWWDRNMPSKQQVTNALGSLGAASKGAQSGAGKGAGTAPQQAALGGGAGARQGQASLGPLLQLLMQNRNALLQSATAGPGGQARPQGLLGV